MATIATLRWWFTDRVSLSLSVVAGLFLIAALFWSPYLLPLNWLWSRFSHAMAVASNHAILGLTFFIIIWPVGIIMRILGKDPMERRFNSEVETYFVPVIRTVDESTFPDLF
ncbi:MAG TPA: SxtJ family membrane protein [Nitrospirales bacterium]|jgi:hypothetical protein